jgi:hypothetical protein
MGEESVLSSHLYDLEKVCICVYIYLSIYMYTYINIYTNTYICIYKYVDKWSINVIHSYIYIHIVLYLYIHIHIYIYIYIYVFLYIYKYIYIFIYIYIYFKEMLNASKDLAVKLLKSKQEAADIAAAMGKIIVITRSSVSG